MPAIVGEQREVMPKGGATDEEVKIADHSVCGPESRPFTPELSARLSIQSDDDRDRAEEVVERPFAAFWVCGPIDA